MKDASFQAVRSLPNRLAMAESLADIFETSPTILILMAEAIVLDTDATAETVLESIIREGLSPSPSTPQ